MSLSGCITALATPFLEDGALDLDAWRRLLLRQRQGGIQGVVVAGSTGEAAALTDEEYTRLLAIATETLGRAVPILAGTGQMNTAKTVAQTRMAAAAGAAFALVVTPAYVRPTQAGLLAHFRAVADEGGLPVVLYNVPSRTGCDLLPSTVAEMVGHPRIVGIKEALSDPARLQALLVLRNDGFAVLGGDDASACDWLLAGADGLVSVGSNVLPASFRRLCDQARAGATDPAHAIDHSLGEYHAFLGVEPNPIPVKALLQRLGYGQGLRLPLLPLSGMHADLADRLAAQVAGLEESSVRETLAA